MDDRTEITALLAEVELFLQATGMAAGYLGLLAAGNGHLIARLRQGGKIQSTTVAKLRAFMEARMTNTAWWRRYPNGKWRKTR